MRYFIVTKRTLFVCALALLSALTVAAAFNGERTVKVSAAQKRLIPIYCVQTDEKKVAVTFDAAWGADDTKQLIEILNKYNAKATFFVVGTWAKEHRDSLKAFYEAGHEIANHSYNHTLYGKLTQQEISADIEKCNAVIQDITGERPALLRAPSGEYTNESEAAAQSLNMRTIQWSVDSLDWQGLSSEEIEKRVINAAENGSIILFHNDVKNTPKALDNILSKLSKRGYSFVTVSELIYKEIYKIDSAGRQIKGE